MAVDATVIAMTLGVLVSLVVSRRGRTPAERRTLAVLDSVFMLPLGVSAVTLGFGFLVTLDRPPLDLRTSPILVPIAQAMVALPLVVRTLTPVLRSIDTTSQPPAASGRSHHVPDDIPAARLTRCPEHAARHRPT